MLGTSGQVVTAENEPDESVQDGTGNTVKENTNPKIPQGQHVKPEHTEVINFECLDISCLTPSRTNNMIGGFCLSVDL